MTASKSTFTMRLFLIIFQNNRKNEFKKEYFVSLREIISNEYKTKTIYPPPKLIFNAFNSTPVEDVKVVIIGQDPYHREGQAHGLCFSVPSGIKPPPSLINIFKELNSDKGKAIPISGNLENWAIQGVLLLNSTLTVVANKANSHKNSGWSTFTDKSIELLSDHRKNIVFLLWGNYAHKKYICCFFDFVQKPFVYLFFEFSCHLICTMFLVQNPYYSMYKPHQ